MSPGIPHGAAIAQRSRHSAKTKALLTVGLLSATLVGLGTVAFATFTSTTNVPQTTSTGTVAFAPINANGANNRLSLGAVDVAAGDTMQRAVTLTNTGSIDMLPASVTLTTTAAVPTLLTTDVTNGLQVVIDKCSQPWTESGTAPAYTYTCGGTTSSVLAQTSVIQSATALSNLTTTAGADNYLRVTLSLPTAAPNTFQNLTTTIDYLFAGTQRNGTNK